MTVINLLKQNKENKLIDILINISKVSIRSIFTAKKYDNEILDEDLRRILFIRNLLEESFEFVKKNHKEEDKEYFNYIYSNLQYDGIEKYRFGAGKSLLKKAI